MIASSMSNYVILSIAGLISSNSAKGERSLNVLLLNVGITLLGVLLAIYVNKEFNKK